ncbi:MAG: helix-turn-helix domain-containing protein [Lachnospiraceae bacterium]
MIIRAEKTKDSTVAISNYPFRDENISLEAKGLLFVMLNFPDDWNFSVEDLTEHCKDGVDSVQNALNELIEFGYVEKIEGVCDETGKPKGIDYIIHEQPVSQKLENESKVSDAEESILENAACKDKKKEGN